MNPYDLVCSKLDKPRTLGELAALTGLHVLGVEATLRELGPKIQVGLRKCKKSTTLKVYVLRAKPVPAAEADSKVLTALTQYGPSSRLHLTLATGLSPTAVKRSIGRLNSASLIESEGGHLWKRTYNECLATNINANYEFKTKFVNDRNPWLCELKRT